MMKSRNAPAASTAIPAARGRVVQLAFWTVLQAGFLAGLSASEPWAPPSPFPEQRYENGWRKNPFTLKTAPVAIQRESFAKNLALGSMYDDVDGVTSVVIVNTKTRERSRLRGQEPGDNGMRVEESVIADTRRDSYAVVTMGGEKATLRYDEAFLKQMAAGGGASPTGAGAAQQRAASNGAEPSSTGQPAPLTAMNGAPATGSGGSAPNASLSPGSGNGPAPTPPGVRTPFPTGRPTIANRRRLTAPQGVPQSPPAPLMPTDNP
ncbi:hypothetical protein [Verrucomicrobium sp. BvORR106]|uniref:hypothetical protein n=1 Tax=Verrucomicrobium sp. BvORR106 TaxID=1403819 RepID=UPI00056F097F|nr:hypothetical protein [Verrucomicrobium sp. BvORR106]